MIQNCSPMSWDFRTNISLHKKNQKKDIDFSKGLIMALEN